MLLDFGLIGVADEFTRALPPFYPWHHEEWHRAVMSQYDIGSYNDIYNIPYGESVVAVSHVEDDDLVRLTTTARHGDIYGCRCSSRIVLAHHGARAL